MAGPHFHQQRVFLAQASGWKWPKLLSSGQFQWTASVLAGAFTPLAKSWKAVLLVDLTALCLQRGSLKLGPHRVPDHCFESVPMGLTPGDSETAILGWDFQRSRSPGVNQPGQPKDVYGGGVLFSLSE